LRYVNNSEVNGPVIIVKDYGDIDLNAHKTLKNNLRKVGWLSFIIREREWLGRN
jgi:hypothetical protein